MNEDEREKEEEKQDRQTSKRKPDACCGFRPYVRETESCCGGVFLRASKLELFLIRFMNHYKFDLQSDY